MKRTTVYLPADLQAALKRASRERRVSEAELIRMAIRDLVGSARPAPRGGLFAGPEPIADDLDRHLAGFGER